MAEKTLDSIIFAGSAFTVAPVWAPPVNGPGVISGTSGDDVIDASYTGDPEGDMIDNNDALLAGEVGNDDIVLAGAGNDTVRGEAGNDEIYGGTGDDFLKGLEGDDQLFGEDGDDFLVGGEGADTVIGGSGNDYIYGGNAGDVVDGSTEGSDYDTLDLRENGPLRVVGQTVDADGDSTSGTIEFLDADGNVTGTMTFAEIENLLLPEDPPNQDPVANDDAAITPFETVVNIDVLGNDTDADGDSLSILGTPTSADGTVTVNPDGTLDFIPADGFTGDATIEYEITDGNGGTDRGTVTVAVGAAVPDGIVSGTVGDDLIDVAYTGDPDGDMIDNDDAILPGEAPNDDIVEAGDGNDTIISGEGSDEVYGGEGDDLIDTSNAAPANDHVTFLGVPVDADPEDDRDYVEGGAGNDTITTGDDADTIYGGEGDDSINSGWDDDDVYGGAGNDYIDADMGADFVDGGDGDDTIIAGFDAFSDYTGDDTNLPNPLALNPDGTPAVTDPNVNDGMDTVYGGAGNDIIITGDDADEIYGGADNDTINAGIDDDYVDGGTGNDSIIGGHGSDTIMGGEGDDFIVAGDSTMLYPNTPDPIDPLPDNDRDYVDGGAGNDTISGQDDDDTLLGGDGDDLLDGGIDEDLLEGGAGNDTIITGEGADVAFGGDDRDTFLGASAGDVIDGNEGGDDYDTLDLTGSAPDGGSLRVLYDANPENGTVEFSDSTGTVTGTMDFSNIENVIPCFTPGTVIATPKGERLVEDLVEGDRIITRDNGIQEIRWIGAKALTGQQLVQNPQLKPILIQAGSLGKGLPEHDMLVSPNHRILLSNDKTALYFEEREVLAAAKHLTGMAGVDAVDAMGTTYIHFMFDQHEVVLSNGAWTESFQPGDQTLNGIGEAQRSEIFELFPELQTLDGIDAYQSARRSLRKHEAKLLVK